jgi:hypothetical protein
MRTVEVRILPAARRGRSRRAGRPRRPHSRRPRVRIPLPSMAVRSFRCRPIGKARGCLPRDPGSSPGIGAGCTGAHLVGGACLICRTWSGSIPTRRTTSPCSSTVERRCYKAEVGGSTPPAGTQDHGVCGVPAVHARLWTWWSRIVPGQTPQARRGRRDARPSVEPLPLACLVRGQGRAPRPRSSAGRAPASEVEGRCCQRTAGIPGARTGA